METRIDHLVYTVPHLGEGMDAMEAMFGVRPVPGGRHPLLGSHNALLSLGDETYLEVVAPDPDLTRPPRGVVFEMEAISGPRLATWALRSEAIEDAVSRASQAGVALGPVLDGSRERPDGTVLRWRLSDPYAMAFGGVVPFLIAWGDSPHPARSAPHAGVLLALEAQHPDPVGVVDVFGALDVDLSPGRGPVPRLSARIRLADGTTCILE